MSDEILSKQIKNTVEKAELSSGKSWVKGALKRGFYSAVQAFHAGNLSLLRFIPGATFEKTQEKLAHRIEHWEKKIQENDIIPHRPGRLKSGASFLLYNSTYLLPVLATGFASGLIGGSSFIALAAAGIFNAHTMMGEALVKTVRKHVAELEEIPALQQILSDKEFSRTATINTSMMGLVFLGVGLAAGPLARLLGGATSSLLRLLPRIPLLDGLLANQFLNAAHRSAVKSTRKPLGKLFAHAAHKGTRYFERGSPVFIASTHMDIPSLGQHFPREPVGDEMDEAVIEVVLLPEPETAKAEHVSYPLEPGE